MGARSFAAGALKAPKRRIPPKRPGGPHTKAELALVQQFVQDQPGEITPSQERALARTLRRSTDAVRGLIEEARLKLGEAVDHYVDTHRMAVDLALANGDAKSLEVAVRGSQWALENISVDGQRVVERAQAGPSGVKILVGVKIGGANTPAAPAGAEECVECVVGEGVGAKV